jgi:23S rRNA (uracil1939-C5)-methyltransferase
VKEQIVKNVEVIDIADKGLAVAKDADGQIYMVEKLVPGDKADIRIFKRRKGVKFGAPLQIISESPYRQAAFCQHFGTCGGCKWQHMSYAAQLQFKEQTVLNAIRRIGKTEIPEIYPILGSISDQFYRNKMEYSFSNKRWLFPEEMNTGTPPVQPEGLGFHTPGAFDKVVDIHQCFLQDDLANTIRNKVRNFALQEGFTFFDLRAQKGLLRNLMIRNTSIGEWMVVVVFYEHQKKNILSIMQMLKDEFPQITSLQYIINSKKNDTIYDQEVVCYSGKDHIIEQLDQVRYKISAKSFFQTNSHQAKRLYDITKLFAGLTGNENVYDLYTGTGSIALYVADQARHVVGIEEVDAAIQDAKVNMQLNSIKNTTFYTGDVKDILTQQFITDHGKADVVITDPPRAGMHDKVIDTLLALEAPRIVYVSCNPATQARDIALLSNKYKLQAIQPVDMFPHTHHIENVARLDLK